MKVKVYCFKGWLVPKEFTQKHSSYWLQQTIFSGLQTVVVSCVKLTNQLCTISFKVYSSGHSCSFSVHLICEPEMCTEEESSELMTEFTRTWDYEETSHQITDVQIKGEGESSVFQRSGCCKRIHSKPWYWLWQTILSGLQTVAHCVASCVKLTNQLRTISFKVCSQSLK